MMTERNNESSMEMENDVTTVKEEESSEIQRVKSATEKESYDTLHGHILQVYLDVLAKIKRTDPRAIAAKDVLRQFLGLSEAEREDAIEGVLKALGSIYGDVIPPKWLYHTVHEPGLNIVFSDRVYFVDGRGSYRKVQQW